MDADELYGVPLEQFVPERTALAKSMRADGRPDEAKAVAALRKPSVAAWAVNQLVRTQRQAVDDLFAAGDELVEVQSGVLAGGRDPGELREATTAQREAVDELLAAARGLLSSEGHELSQSVLDRVGETLQAAALDAEAREQVQGATLVRELRHVGLVGGLTPGAASATGPARPTSASSQTSPKRAKPARKGKPASPSKPTPARADVKQAQRERTDQRRAARHDEADSRRAAERAQRALEIANERRDKAAQVLAEADRAVQDAQRTAERTASAHREAKQALDAL